jgi:predicted site-specific integrase-resolvase
MLHPNEAAATAGVSVRTVNRWVEAGAVHFNETANGLLLICANSVGEVDTTCQISGGRGGER